MNPAIHDWRKALFLVFLTWGALIALLLPTGTSMWAIWDRSETYAHGFVVLPISLWLAWRNRSTVMSTPAAPDLRALPLAALIGLIWLASRVAGVQVGEHYALVALAITAVWLLLGWRLTRVLLFPLLFLLMMVPNGEYLMAPLMDFTADFTVFMLRLLDIPVFREGTFFSIQSGDWSVVEACSGIRYFLSSLMLGILYAYLTYRTGWKRLLFVLASIIVPVIANGMRATLIVLIAHYSDMKLATGIDHYIYGWVWFGIVMLAMFWIGNYWREDEPPADTGEKPAVSPSLGFVPAGLLVAVTALFPLYEGYLDNRPAAPSPLAAIEPPAGWHAAATPVTPWVPSWSGMDDQRILQLAHGQERVMLFAAWYGTQRQDAELISFVNQLVPQEHEIWRKPTEYGREVEFPQGRLPVREALVDAPTLGQHLLVWQWNRIAGEAGTSIMAAKLKLAWQKLSGQDDAGAAIIVAAPYLEKPEEAEAVLRRFVSAIQPAMNAALDKAGP